MLYIFFLQTGSFSSLERSIGITMLFELHTPNCFIISGLSENIYLKNEQNTALALFLEKSLGLVPGIKPFHLE
jgi:hypothetical protein